MGELFGGGRQFGCNRVKHRANVGPGWRGGKLKAHSDSRIGLLRGGVKRGLLAL